MLGILQKAQTRRNGPAHCEYIINIENILINSEHKGMVFDEKFRKFKAFKWKDIKVLFVLFKKIESKIDDLVILMPVN